MIKNDPARESTDKILKQMERRIKKEYQQAEKEVEAKLADYLRRFEVKDKIKRDQLKRGVITAKEYKDWRLGQIAMGKRWAEMKDVLAQDYSHARNIAQGIVYNYLPEVYAVNHNYATYAIEHETMIDTSYTLYNREAVKHVLNDNKIYHDAGKKMRADIANRKAVAWDKEKIQSVMVQGILQGESIPNLTKRLESVTEGDHKAAIRNARTMATGVENAGHLDAAYRAKEMGIKVKKQWSAHLDARTRHSHRQLDGEIKDIEEPFSNGCMMPGDPHGAPEEIYNCRCRCDRIIEGHERDMSDLTRRDSNLGDMSYEEWKAQKESESHSITKQEQIAAVMKGKYIQEYKR